LQFYFTFIAVVRGPQEILCSNIILPQPTARVRVSTATTRRSARSLRTQARFWRPTLNHQTLCVRPPKGGLCFAVVLSFFHFYNTDLRTP